ncbi:MAG: hypothetical protein ACRENS_03040 [Candidatus Eiseniibacteriota bacterium]
MAGLLQSLLGNGAREKEMAEEMRAMLQEMQHERVRYQTLVESARASAMMLEQFGETILRTKQAMDSATARVHEVEMRLEALAKLTQRYETLDDRAETLTQGQQHAQTQIATAMKDAEQIRTVFEELSQRVDLAVSLKDKLGSFLEVERPFQQMRGDADALREQLHGTSEHVTRLREQHDRMMDAQKLSMSKMEALDLRREELARSIHDKERRVAIVEQSVKSMDGVQNRVDDVMREMGTLKALGDGVAQKTAAIEAQRDAVERALALADRLSVAMRQIDAGVRQQQDNEKALASMQEQAKSLHSLHESVIERSREISQLQRDTDTQAQATRQDLSIMRDEMKVTVERFDFESKGLESISQRVADLRGALTDFENRFRGLTESSQQVAELKLQVNAMGTHLNGLHSEVGSLDEELGRLQAMRREVDEISKVSREASVHVDHLREARPALDAALRDFDKLSGTQAAVRDALEQSVLAHNEIARVREGQSETRSWLGNVEQSMGTLREKVGELSKLAPMVDSVQKQAQRIGESVSAIEARREFIEDMHRRMADLGALGSKLDERGRQLQARMEGAEQRFSNLAAQADEADRVAKSVGQVSVNLSEAETQAEQIRRSVSEIEARCESVESLAERTNLMRQELEQRHHALEEATRDLHHASQMRQEAAASAQQLDGLSKRLTASLDSADRRVARVDSVARQLEDRASTLQGVEKRLDQFEGRLAKWDLVEQDIARSLEGMVARQGTVESLQADLDRMFVMAEKTASDVKSITSAHREIEESRGLLKEVLGRLNDIKNTSSTLDERKRQMGKAEERLSRAEALLMDVRSSLESLQGQKAIVDQAVERAGSLRFLLKQAEAMIEMLREEREVTARVRNAVAVVREADRAADAKREHPGSEHAA